MDNHLLPPQDAHTSRAMALWSLAWVAAAVVLAAAANLLSAQLV
jgi:hypothetical protein